MKQVSFILISLFSFFSSYATNVQGIIYGNVTWTKANSPYHVINNVLIDSLAKLTIEPGVEVRVDQSANFYIEGQIQAIGLQGNMIHFTGANANAYWNGLEFRKQTLNDSLFFQFCHFDSAIYGIKGDNLNLTLKNCLFENCYTYLSNSLFSARNNIFKNTQFILSNYNNPYGDISENDFSGSYIRLGGGSINSSYTVLNNYFHDLSCLFISTTVDFSEISGNTFINNKSALYISNSKMQHAIGNNVFAYNETAITTEGGVYASFENNTMKYNAYAVYIKNAVSLKFEHNCFEGNTQYDVMLKSISKFNFDFTNNYWGKTDSADIHDKIFDFHNDLAQAIIYYVPFLSQADSSCQQVAPPTIPCDPPSKINITSATLNGAVIYWDTVSKSKGYQYSILPHPSTPLVTGPVLMNNTVLANGLEPGGTYDICVRNICISDSSEWVCDTIVIPATDVPTVPDNDKLVLISPNPFRSSFDIRIQGMDITGTVIISDIVGKQVLSLPVQEHKKMTVNMEQFPAGIYIYRLTDKSGKIYTGRINKD